MDVQAYGGRPFAERTQQAGQDGQGEGGGEADAQAACPALADLAGRGEPLSEAGEGVPGRGKQFAARRGEGDASWFAGEQRVTHLVLQAPYLLAQRRLRDTEARGGVAEVQFVGEDDEGVQLSQGKFGAFHTLRDITPWPTLY